MLRILLAALLCLPVLSACSGPQVLSALNRAPDITVTTDLIFMPGPRGKLDIYQPAPEMNPSGKAPVVIFFYGGRWSDGNRSEYQFVGETLAKMGFVTVVPDYRVYPTVTFPAFVEDAARAVVSARELAPRHGGDPERVFVMGHSAGAHIAAMLATDRQHMRSAGGSRDMIRGMIGLAGPYDFLPVYAEDLLNIFGRDDGRAERAQPVNYVDASMPPVLLLHGENDNTVKAQNSSSFAREITKAGGDAKLVLYDNLSHARIIASLSTPLARLADVDDQIKTFVLEKSRSDSIDLGGGR